MKRRIFHRSATSRIRRFSRRRAYLLLLLAIVPAVYVGRAAVAVIKGPAPPSISFSPPAPELGNDLRMTTVVYPVADLLTVKNPRTYGDTMEVRSKILVQVVKDCIGIGPDDWIGRDANVGSIDCEDDRLIVSATGKMHAQVRWLLANLRKR